MNEVLSWLLLAVDCSNTTPPHGCSPPAVVPLAAWSVRACDQRQPTASNDSHLSANPRPPRSSLYSLKLSLSLLGRRMVVAVGGVAGVRVHRVQGAQLARRSGCAACSLARWLQIIVPARLTAESQRGRVAYYMAMG